MNILSFIRGNNRIEKMDEIDGDVLTKDLFNNNYFIPRKPLLIKKGANKWPLMQKWTQDYLINQYGNYQCNITHDSRPESSKDMTLIKHYFRLHKNKGTLTVSLKNYKPNENKFFLNDIKLPNICFEEKDIERFFFYHSNKNQGTLPHSHGNAFNILQNGVKHWIMHDANIKLAPKGNKLMMNCYKEYSIGTHVKDWFSKELKNLPQQVEKVTQCIQKAGDIVFIPKHYSHAVLNKSEVIGLVIVNRN